MASFKGFIPSLRSGEERYGGNSFMQTYPFIHDYSEKIGVDIITLDEFAQMNVTTFNQLYKQKHAGRLSTNVIKNLQDELDALPKNRRGVVEDPSMLYYRQVMTEYISEIFKNLCYRKPGILENIETVLRCGRNARFCGARIPYDFINITVVENSIADLTNEMKDREELMLIVLDKNDNNRVIGFISGARIMRERDVYGHLICTNEKREPKGIGKLLLATTILMTKDSDVRYVYLGAAGGKIGQNASLYSRFGFRFGFPQELLETKTAIEENIKREVEEWTTPFRIVPMWMSAKEVDIACIGNILYKKSWTCETGGEGSSMGWRDPSSAIDKASRLLRGDYYSGSWDPYRGGMVPSHYSQGADGQKSHFSPKKSKKSPKTKKTKKSTKK